MGDELKSQITALVDNTEKLVTKVGEMDQRVISVEQNWRKDLSDVQETVKAIKAAGGSVDKEAVSNWIGEILDKQHAETKALRMSGGGLGGAPEVKMPDYWKKGYEIDLDRPLDFKEPSWEPKAYMEQGAIGLKTVLSFPAQDQNHKHLLRVADDAYLLDQLARLSQPGHYKGFEKHFPRFARIYRQAIADYGRSVGASTKATSDVMDLTDTANWIASGWNSELRELITLELKVAALFPRFTMPQNPYILPIDLTDTLPDYVAETGTAANFASDTTMQILVDAKATFTAKKLRGRLMATGELMEDSIVPMLPLIRRKLVQIMSSGLETAILNSDTGTHQDTDITAATDCRKSFLGLRGWIIDQSFTVNAGAAAPTTALLLSLRKYMGEWAVDPSRLAYIVGMSNYISMLDMDEVQTVDKIGPQATMLSGQLASFMGSPVIVSRYVREDVDLNGIHAAGTNTFTTITAVHRDGWMIGDRRELSLESQRIANYDQEQILAWQRLDFQSLYGTAYKTAALLRNLTV